MDKSHLQFLITLVILSAICFGLLYSMVAEGQPLRPQMDMTGKPIMVTVYVYENAHEVQLAHDEYRGSVGRGRDTDLDRLGWAAWPGSGRWCDIHAVRPSNVDDAAVKTLGHEILHCLYGQYHE